LQNLDKTKKISILEIGAGNGISTKNFINELNKNNINYDYTVNEYKKQLLKILPIDNIKIMSFENLPVFKYDLILLTCSFQLNDDNINNLYNLCKHSTIIMTISPIINPIKKYFNIIYIHYLSLFLKIFKCTIKS
jgi:predicted O-methyltransferase YrrM